MTASNNNPSIILCGFMGCGKTTVGRRLARLMKMPFIDTDTYVRDLAGVSIHDMLVAGDLASVRAWEMQAVQELSAMSGVVIATGAGVCTIDQNAAAFHENGYLVYLKRNFDTVYPKISSDPVRIMAYRKSYEEMKALHDMRIPLYSKYADLIVDNNASHDACARLIAAGYRDYLRL